MAARRLSSDELNHLSEVARDPIKFAGAIFAHLLIASEEGNVEATKILLDVGMLGNLQRRFWAQQQGHEYPLTEELNTQFKLTFE